MVKWHGRSGWRPSSSICAARLDLNEREGGKAEGAGEPAQLNRFPALYPCHTPSAKKPALFRQESSSNNNDHGTLRFSLIAVRRRGAVCKRASLESLPLSRTAAGDIFSHPACDRCKATFSWQKQLLERAAILTAIGLANRSIGKSTKMVAARKESAALGNTKAACAVASFQVWPPRQRLSYHPCKERCNFYQRLMRPRCTSTCEASSIVALTSMADGMKQFLPICCSCF